MNRTELERLRRRLERERSARQEAETVAEDTTRRLYAAVENLRRANRDLDEFAYVASHDLRAPMRAIDNLAQWVEEDLGEDLPAESRQHLALLRSRVQRMNRLLDGLLKYARVGRKRVTPEPVDVAELLNLTIDSIQRPESFQIRVTDGMPTFETALVPLQQVFDNLIGNAVKHHGREDGRVVVRCRDAGELYEFEVSDDGPGIPERYHDRVFKLFQTLRRRDEVEGSGMGLALVQKHVSACGGSVQLISAEGGGTTFSFSWPKRWTKEHHDD